MNAIPAEITHLDFEPQTDEEITPAPECEVVLLLRVLRFWERRTPCHRMATARVTLRCCMSTGLSCTEHRSANRYWHCLTCGHRRGPEWLVWRPL